MINESRGGGSDSDGLINETAAPQRVNTLDICVNVRI